MTISLKGKRRYKCADCGGTQFENAYSMARRTKVRCRGCGGTFLEADTDGAKEQAVTAGSARAIVEKMPPTTAREHLQLQNKE